VVSGNTTLGDAAADLITFNAAAWTWGNDVTMTRAVGAVAAGFTAMKENVTFSTTAPNLFGIVRNTTNTFSGAQNLNSLTVHGAETTPGATSIVAEQRTHDVHASLSGTGNATNVSGIKARVNITGAGGITGIGAGFRAGRFLNNTGTIAVMNGFYAEDLGDATRIPIAHGFNCADFTAGPTLSASYRGQMSTGTGKWNCYMDGTAPNFFSGAVIQGPQTLLVSSTLFNIANAGFISHAGPGTSPPVAFVAIYAGDDAFGNNFNFTKSRGTPAAPVLPNSGDTVGSLNFLGFTGTFARTGAKINALVDGVPGADPDMPMRLVFHTMPDGGPSILERLRITNAGQLWQQSQVAIPAGGAANIGVAFSSTANFGVFAGSGVPTLSAAKGSLYLRSDGSATNNRAYINTDGAATWTPLTTAA
jgi:hypothetical protein